MPKHRIKTAQSRAPDARAAAREFHAGVAQEETALVVFFCSSHYDLDALADELKTLFGDIALAGCTSAGEIGPAGYLTHSLSGASFPAQSCTAASDLLPELHGFEPETGHQFSQELVRRLEARLPPGAADNTFALLLIDGLSVREEPVARALQQGLERIPVIGGSAGDDLGFRQTRVFHDGAFHDNSAVLTLINTKFPFSVFKTQHFVSTDQRLVVTEADTARRIVREINGLPAAAEYARLVGVALDLLTPTIYAGSPVIVRIDGADYVRSIQSINADGSITLFCAIEEGVVLRIGRGVDMLGNLQLALEDVSREVGPPQLVLSCDCILRSVEISQLDMKEQFGDLLSQYNAVGFNTYGEQYGGLHVNQTMTGIAIGEFQHEGDLA